MRTYLREFAGDTRGWLRELAGERRYVGIGLVVLFLPLIFLADVLVYLFDEVGTR